MSQWVTVSTSHFNRTNNYPANCCVCAAKVASQCGYLLAADDVPEAFRGRRKWLTICTSKLCAEAIVGPEVVEAANQRALLADGTIVMPYDEDSLPLLRAFAAWDGKRWRASLLLRDRDHVLALADRLGLDVAAELREYEDPPSVKAAVARARAIDTIREYQVEGVRWLAYRGLTDGEPRSYEDKKPGAIEADDQGLGKQQPVDTKVLTPTGWKEIGTLKKGDFVIGSDGTPTEVTGVFPQGVKPSFRVHFSGGASVEAGPDHLWGIDVRRNGRTKSRLVLTTEQLRTRPAIEGKGSRPFSLKNKNLYIPVLSAPVEFGKQPKLPIPPYTLGALIANGGLSHGSAQLTVGSCDWQHVLARLQTENANIRKCRQYVPSVITTVVCGIVPALRTLGLNVGSKDKFIPDVYKLASVEDRVALLHGLMDGDGSCSKTRNKLSYHTMSKRLAEDFQELVECLGGIANVLTYDRTHEDKGMNYYVTLRLPSNIAPFSLPRKALRYSPGTRTHPTRRVQQVEYARDVESVCISVAAEDNLYVTEHAILTHNTIQVLLQLRDCEALVVVCPANAKAVWVREAKKWRPNRFDTFTMIDGRENFRWPEATRELVVVNYDVLPYTPAQIRNERDNLHDVRYGRAPNPRAKTKDEREGVVGLREQMRYVLDNYRDTRDLPQSTATRHRLYLLAQQGLILRDKLVRNMNALKANAKRVPASKPKLPVLIVADEAHYLENHKALRTQRWKRLAGMSSRVIGLTGTPVESEPLKLWGLLQSLRCNPFSWKKFNEQFNAFKADYGGIDFLREPPAPGSTARGPVKVQPGTTEILQRVMLRRTKDEVLTELPPKVYSEIPVELPENLVARLDEVAAQHIDTLLRGELPAFDEMAALRKALAAASIPAMLEFVESYEQQGLPLVVFSAHRGPIEKLGKRKHWSAITGDTSARKRGEIQDEFQRADSPLLGVAGTRAMAEAMTLTRASTVLFVDRFWELKFNCQAEDRIHRIGQLDSVNVVTLVPDHPLTRHVADLLGSKSSFVDSVLHGEAQYEANDAGRFVDESKDQWAERVQAKRDADARREQSRLERERRQQERALAAIAEREITPQQSEQRAKLRAQRVGVTVKLSDVTPEYVRTVQDALAHMLSVCDGAQVKDNVGFNKPDGCVARWLAPAVGEGLPFAVVSAASILRHYPRQLRERWPELFAQ